MPFGIIEKLERIAHLPALYPADPAERSEALALQADFDGCLGPNVRRALFSQMVDEGAYFCRMFASGKSLPARLAYRAVYPMAKGLIKKANGITDQASIGPYRRTDGHDWLSGGRAVYRGRPDGGIPACPRRQSVQL